jgi:hypothetical protein
MRQSFSAIGLLLSDVTATESTCRRFGPERSGRDELARRVVMLAHLAQVSSPHLQKKAPGVELRSERVHHPAP